MVIQASGYCSTHCSSGVRLQEFHYFSVHALSLLWFTVSTAYSCSTQANEFLGHIRELVIHLRVLFDLGARVTQVADLLLELPSTTKEDIVQSMLECVPISPGIVSLFQVHKYTVVGVLGETYLISLCTGFVLSCSRKLLANCGLEVALWKVCKSKVNFCTH